MKLKNVETGTWVRLALLTAALAGNILSVFGIDFSPGSGAAAKIVSTVLVVLTSLLAYWKNNSFTDAAIFADRLMKGLKEENNKNNK
ncbi:MAG: holin [Clostridia bacterium]|nr:holin [Clostridia bacterium]